METTYPYEYLYVYLPKRYPASLQNQLDRNEVYCFKAGYCSDRTKRGLLAKIQQISSSAPEDYLIVFITGQGADCMKECYERLASWLQESSGIRTSLTAVKSQCDRGTLLAFDKQSNQVSLLTFQVDELMNRNIILVDDVIIFGHFFQYCADRLMALGAKSVTGLFVAKITIPENQDEGYECSDSEDFMENEFFCESSNYIEDYNTTHGLL